MTDHSTFGKETVLVTGGAGYIAQWCIIELLRQGYCVRATVRDSARGDDLRGIVEHALGDAQRLSLFNANLEEERGWPAAMEGCTYVLHLASPFPAATPADESELIRPAREGTLRVLRHAVAAGVRRVVLTSSSATMAYAPGRPEWVDESLWTDAAARDITPYTRSKTLAERAAWEFMRGAGDATSLVTIAPNTVIGPVLDRRTSYSVDSIRRLLDGSAPALPSFGFSLVDVRDIADLHLRAMTHPEAAGRRILGAGTFLWYAEVAAILREHLGATGQGAVAKKIPRRTLPNPLVRLLALFDPSLKPILPELGVRQTYSAKLAQELLQWQARPVAQTIVECAESLLARKLVGP